MKTKTKVDKDLGKVVERIMDAGFDASIRERMDDEDYQRVVDKALGGNQAAQVRYIERFLDVVGEIDGELRRDLVRKMAILGAEDGVEEFFEDVGDRVLLFENEVLDMLKDIDEGFLPMETPMEVELEEEVALPDTCELIFRFWAPGEGTEPVAEFTALNPEDRPDFIREGIHDVIAASWIPYLRRIVEDTLHDLQKKPKEVK